MSFKNAAGDLHKDFKVHLKIWRLIQLISTEQTPYYYSMMFTHW